MFDLNRANATRTSRSLFVSTSFFVLLVQWGCTRINPEFEAAPVADAGARPDGAPVPALPSAADTSRQREPVFGGGPSATPRACAGHPRFTLWGQKVFLDGSGSVVPPGCTLGWAAVAGNPGASTLSVARLPMLEVRTTSPGLYRYMVTVTCPESTSSDTTAVHAFARPVPMFKDRRFVYREGSVAGDNSVTGPKGRRFVFSPAQHPMVKETITEVWPDVAGKRLKMSPEAGVFTRWVPTAAASDEHGYWAFVRSNRYASVRRALRTHRAAGLYAHLSAWLKHYHKRGVVVPHASGDAGRVVTSLAGEGFGAAQAAATLALTAPGSPLLLAGDEVGLLAQGGSDAERRYGGAFPWGAGDKHQTGEPGGGKLNKPATLATQQADAHSLHAHYRGLIKARRTSKALGDPAAAGYHYSELTDPGVFAMVRQSGKARALVVVNLTAAFKKVSFSERPKSTLLYRVGYGAGSTLGPYGTHIYRLP